MAYPKNMPQFVEVDISGLELGKSIKVEELLTEEYDILNSPLVSVVSVNIPRVKIEVEEDDDETEGEEGTEGEVTEGTEGKPEDSKKDGDNKESEDSKEEQKD